MATLIQELDPNRDCVNLYALGNKIVALVADYRLELANYDENDFDGMYDYISGLISAYETVAGMIGVPNNLIYPEKD